MGEKYEDASMDKEIEELLRGALPQGLVTNFVLIAEIVSDSQQEMVLSVSDSMTPWLATGTLRVGFLKGSER